MKQDGARSMAAPTASWPAPDPARAHNVRTPGSRGAARRRSCRETASGLPWSSGQRSCSGGAVKRTEKGVSMRETAHPPWVPDGQQGVIQPLPPLRSSPDCGRVTPPSAESDTASARLRILPRSAGNSAPETATSAIWKVTYRSPCPTPTRAEARAPKKVFCRVLIAGRCDEKPTRRPYCRVATLAVTLDTSQMKDASALCLTLKSCG